MIETISTRSGLALQVERQAREQELEISLQLQPARNCVLHWGLREPGQDAWRLPPQQAWPADTHLAGAAAQTPFTRDNGNGRIILRLPQPVPYSSLDFVLFFPDQKSWDNNKGQNYRIELPKAGQVTIAGPGAAPAQKADLEATLRDASGQQKILFQRTFDIEPLGRLAAALSRSEGRFMLDLVSDIPNLLFHWGIARYSSYEWFVPPPALRPAGTVLYEGHTAQTPFAQDKGLSRLRLEFPEGEAPMGLQFVLKQTGSNQWLRYRGANFFVPIRFDYEQRAGLSAPELAEMASEIIQAEMARGSWTLMHRFNLCYDLLERAGRSADGLALLFVWLRYSVLRQLTWQRNYNTKPRELSHAEDRLTQKLAQLYAQQAEQRPLLRLMLGNVGPGGEGQRIRDEILQIMHRHHVKEVAGHFLEEWHQKLHNNTTPDDIVICEAYLEFLYTDGNRERFYQKLQEGGVTRQRLEQFERPIVSEPDFVPHLKEGLIHDFQSFLRTLRSVHAGTDLETAINNARGKLDGDTQGLVSRLLEHRQGQIPLPALVAEITETRRRLQQRLSAGEAARELLYLDLSLEQFLRLEVERNLQHGTDGDTLVPLIASLLQNRLFSNPNPELAACSRDWERLQDKPRFSSDWSLHAKSVVDRVARVVGELIDRTYQLLQPKAEMLGHAFHAEAWIITLFSEEVVRGNSLDFALSMVLRNLEPVLRKAAHLGNWQIVSRGTGQGQVEVVARLRDVQGKSFDGPRVIVADHINGDEDIPESVTAVIAPDVTDIVSHVAVRARNAGLLFASCYDRETFERLKSLAGRHVRVRVNPAGDVLVDEQVEATVAVPQTAKAQRARIARPPSAGWALAEQEFAPALTGGKSLNLARIAGKLPGWIRRPTSIAVPFGVFERVLALKTNRTISEKLDRLLAQVETAPANVLTEMRETVLQLEAPAELNGALQEKAKRAALAWKDDGQAAWRCIKLVWASKWNERAFFSRKTQGLPHEELFMAVLIQQVVEADYAFVAHTVNPFTGHADELYAEMVIGLGETLVGNYPGRALSAVCDKKTKTATLLAYPSKSIALRGQGLIFRSDSNGEDLAGFAGAGLYDSVLMTEPQRVLADYSAEPLVWDQAFRGQTLQRITELGLAVETALGGPQDLEGVVSKGEYFLVQTRPQVGTSTKAEG
jgi:alpha-glucan,water dikinase